MVSATVFIADGTEEMELWVPSTSELVQASAKRQPLVSPYSLSFLCLWCQASFIDMQRISSTITYDTLVRAGLTTTSVFVPAPGESAGPTAIATCSRGVKIVADTTLDQLGETFVRQSWTCQTKDQNIDWVAHSGRGPSGCARWREGRGDDFAECYRAASALEAIPSKEASWDDLCRYALPM